MDPTSGSDGTSAEYPSSREQWQRAIASVASRSGVANSPGEGDRMFASVREATFVHRLNSRKSFAAAFGQRSLSGKLSAQPPERRSNADAVSNAKLGTSAKSPLHGASDPDQAAEEVEIRCDAGSLMVCSGMSKDFTLEANVRFKPSQFLRTTLYELVPGPLSFFVVLLVEMLAFGHTLEEARCAAGTRQKLPFFVFPGPSCRFFRVVPDFVPFVNIALMNEMAICLILLATNLSPDVRQYVEPMEAAPLVILYVCRALVIASKYSLLPESFVSDRGGKLYRRIVATDMTRTLVAAGWNDPKNADHPDFLRMEMERACLEADVDLSETEIDVGSSYAARTIRLRARGLGWRGDAEVAARPSVVSGKELLAAVMDTHIGKDPPGTFFPIILVITIAFVFVSPACRATVGAPMFGGSPFSRAIAALIFIETFFFFITNLVFTYAMVWNFHRQRDGIKAMNAMMHFPGEPVANFLPKPPRRKRPRAKTSVRSIDDDDDDGEPAEVRELRRAADAGEVILVDLKDPSTCLCWSLVRRAMRKVGSSWSRRLNMFSIVFLLCAFTSALFLVLLFYGAERQTHRLATAASLFYLAIIISVLVAATVLEGSLINDQVPTIRAKLKRETLAMAAQLAAVEAEADDDDGSAAKEARRIRGAHRLVKSLDAHIYMEEDPSAGSDPVEVFFNVPASPAAVTLVASTLLSMLFVAAQRAFTMIETNGWSYEGEMGEFTQLDEPT